MTDKTLLRVENLKLYFRASKGVVQAVDNVDLTLSTNEAVVIIGESGCGKSSMAKALLRLLPRNVDTYSGRVFLNGTDVMALDDEEYRKEIRWVKMSMVPQAAMNSLNPVLKVGDQVAEPMMVHHGVTKEAALEQAKAMFQRVGVPVDFVNRYAFELSGGMRQRVAIAMALVTLPDLVILDEPTSALDVLTQANIMNLLKRIKKEISTSFILITHDIATSSELADRVAVMYAGQIVEVSDSYRFFSAPLHPYSAKLMASVPKLRAKSEPDYITGQPPSLIKPPTGCRFAARCHKRFEKCSEEPPVIAQDGRLVKCWLYT
ncbi:MAG TPA: ABC transporter ATP-binding protein [Anaerolineaceae bacterium]|jgi:oligopeptide/dipeptide ABC transporter ATP-binding protein|nr:ABC transporter ATP-binding protein [Chloroflexota bacterium]HOD43359.1 ABC transporter ATP-binding protein [Anaerolineaceae bacterium]HOU43670.1 ABC transporter ATP-binding protein [Anaerolineaceae bacterium]HPA32201.1 ABC transporter ATP-binding protein [Anaerolineaceae bacterium]HQF45091.1 ABC transporter ATP-binding protein [Anaerolineaceae bacterium]